MADSHEHGPHFIEDGRLGDNRVVCGDTEPPTLAKLIQPLSGESKGVLVEIFASGTDVHQPRTDLSAKDKEFLYYKEQPNDTGWTPDVASSYIAQALSFNTHAFAIGTFLSERLARRPVEIVENVELLGADSGDSEEARLQTQAATLYLPTH